MSWIDKVKSGMTITTGDGQIYKPDWLNASFETEYNFTEFTFIGVPGSLVMRRQPMGARYSMELHFQGPDHLDISQKFRKSNDTSTKPWILEHPLYDIRIVMVTALKYDDTLLNDTKITCTAIETMEAVPLGNFFEPMDQIPIQIEQTTQFAIENLTEIVGPADVITMTQDNTQAYAKGIPIIDPLSGDFEEYTDAFNTAATFIDSATATPILAMTSLIRVIQLPGQFTAGVDQRLKVLFGTFNDLRASLFGRLSVGAKQIFTGEQSACISGMCTAASTPLSVDYKNANLVLAVIDQLSARYRQFVEDLDSLQTANGGSPLSFVADAALLISLNQLVNLTVTNLFNIALNARVERTFVCTKDTNIIKLTHLLYGLDAADNNLNELIENNELGVEEYLQIEKGREIIYYI